MLPLATSAALVAAAFALAAWRDHGAGLLPTGPDGPQPQDRRGTAP